MGDDHKLRVLLINKDLKTPVVASVVFGTSGAMAEVIRLTAPSVTSTDGITLAGNSVAKNGTWTPQPGEKVPCRNGKLEVSLPAASAALLIFE